MSADRTTRVGFVGLGSQGGPMARRIVDAGFPTTLWARRAGSLEPFGDTAAVGGGEPGRARAPPRDVLGVCVVDDAGVDEVLRGPDGALAAMADGSIVIVHSTVHPDDLPAAPGRTSRTSTSLDAPVSGGGHKAADGRAARDGRRPRRRGRPVPARARRPSATLCSTSGRSASGQEAKVLNNTVFAAQLALAAEVFALAATRELDQQAVATILSNGSGRSYAAEVVAGSGFDLEGLAPFAGDLLAKDVGILVDRAGLTDTVLLAAADRALEQMGVTRGPGHT